MKVSDDCFEKIKLHEGFRSKAYLDGGGVPTIGYGSTFYEDKTKVKIGDIITEDRASELFKNVVNKFEVGVNKLLKRTLKQNEFDAIISLVYNIGLGNFTTSTLLSIINSDKYMDKKEYPISNFGFNNSLNIRVKVDYTTLTLTKANFLKWSFDNSKFIEGLYLRRKKEAELYERN